MSRLVRPEELAARLGIPGLAVVEVAFHPDDGPFREVHVPGSRWAHWKRLLWHDTERRFPEPETMAARLGARCRFTPTCSRYGEIVIARDGLVRGGWELARRLARCGPWTPADTIDEP